MERGKMGGERKRILYVDDEEALVFLVPLTMAPLGYEVSPFGSARQALDEFRRRPDDFDAVITDLSMTEMSGFDLARQVHALRPGLPLVITSGYVRAGERDEALAAGAYELVLKPDTVEELGRVLDEAIRSSIHPSKPPK
jgi:CheY-like chemotaxis protein